MLRRAFTVSSLTAPRRMASAVPAALSVGLAHVSNNTSLLVIPSATTSLRFASDNNDKSSNDGVRGGSVEASGDTHPDFQPKAVKPEELTEERESIMNDMRETIRDEDIVVFIKGLPECPVCSFSKKLIDILDALGLEYTSFDVLAHPVVRSYVKELSDWQTIPQMFVKGEFVGGVDVVAEMAKSGQLQMMFERKHIPHKPFQF